MDWRELLRNRWVWAGAAGAAALGGLVWWRARKGGTGGTDAAPAYAASGPVAGFDSTGTDVAAWLGHQSGMLASQLAEFQRSVTAQLGAIQPTTGTGTGTPTPANNPTPTNTGGYGFPVEPMSPSTGPTIKTLPPLVLTR